MEECNNALPFIHKMLISSQHVKTKDVFAKDCFTKDYQLCQHKALYCTMITLFSTNTQATYHFSLCEGLIMKCLGEPKQENHSKQGLMYALFPYLSISMTLKEKAGLKHNPP